MRLLDKTREAGIRVDEAVFQVDMALLKMAAVLDEVQTQANTAKEEIDERRSS